MPAAVVLTALALTACTGGEGDDVQWVSTDRGFARFPGLRWRNPLKPATPA